MHTWESAHTPQLELKTGVPCSRRGSHTGQNQQRITCYWARTPVRIPHTHPESQRLRPPKAMGGVSNPSKGKWPGFGLNRDDQVSALSVVVGVVLEGCPLGI